MLLLIAVCAILAIILTMLGYQFLNNLSVHGENYALSQELKQLEIKKQIAEIERAKQQDAIEYQLSLAERQQQSEVNTSPPVKLAMMIALTIKTLWPLWTVLAGLLIVVLVGYIKKQVTTQEIEKTRYALQMTTQEHIMSALERTLPVYVKGLNQAIRQARPYKEIDTEVIEAEALPAFTGNVHFSQAQNDAEYDDNLIMLGRNTDTGGLAQIAQEDLQSLTIDGLQKQGKSVLLVSQVFTALYRKWMLNHPLVLIIIDIHAGLKDSLLTRLREFVDGFDSLCDRIFDNEDAINTDLPAYLDALLQQGKSNSMETILVFDEYTESIANLEQGKKIEAKVKRLFNYRKAGIYLSLAMFEAGKNAQSAKGLNVSKMSISKALFHTAKDEGARFLPGGSEAATLGKGEFLLLLPGMAEPERIKAPLFARQDFVIFQPYVTQRDQFDAPNDTLTTAAIRTYLKESGLSQNKLGKLAGINKADMSRFMNHQLSGEKLDEVVTALHPIIFPENLKDVIHLKQYRERLEKQVVTGM
jgi:hypothetical protein